MGNEIYIMQLVLVDEEDCPVKTSYGPYGPLPMRAFHSKEVAEFVLHTIACIFGCLGEFKDGHLLIPSENAGFSPSNEYCKVRIEIFGLEVL